MKEDEWCYTGSVLCSLSGRSFFPEWIPNRQCFLLTTLLKMLITPVFSIGLITPLPERMPIHHTRWKIWIANHPITTTNILLTKLEGSKML